MVPGTFFQCWLPAPPDGFEPPLPGPKPGVLPLDDGGLFPTHTTRCCVWVQHEVVMRLGVGTVYSWCATPRMGSGSSGWACVCAGPTATHCPTPPALPPWSCRRAWWVWGSYSPRPHRTTVDSVDPRNTLATTVGAMPYLQSSTPIFSMVMVSTDTSVPMGAAR